MNFSLRGFQRLRELFAEAVAIEPAARDAYLDAECGDDAALRAHVVRLLASHDRAGSFLEHPAASWQAGGQAGGQADRDDDAFTGTGRFTVVRRLGAGGMGVVYEVQDAARGDIVALKTLRRTSAANVYRLKQEFRSLADVTHPNLVCLYELFVEDDRCFFTMELVRGVSFVDHVRNGAHGGVERLVHGLRQLIEGVSALHRRGKLHRDIKPSNVLVTPDGRVVILDFGLIAEVAGQLAGEPRYVRGGTPAYMSPEEAAGAPPSDASDMYGVGVTLYEALTGHIPFEGDVSSVLARKRTSDPPPPADVAPGDVTPELSAVCMGLLHRSPELRLTAAAVLAALPGGVMAASAEPAVAAHDLPFVARRRELQALRDVCDTVARGEPRVAAVYGPSGIGKSALVRHFLAGLTARGETLVFRGRCYENETVPYQALDGVIDDLTHHLQQLPRASVDALVSPDVVALLRVFPVLLQVGAFADTWRDRSYDGVDPLRVRRQALDAFAAILRALARRRPLVVWIDDLQWADADSIVLLEALLDATAPPAVLTLLSFRSEESARQPFLQSLLARAQPALCVEPLTDGEAQALIRGLLQRGTALTDRDTRQMTREAAGSPFVLEQLALHAGGAGRASSQAPTFARMFESRLDALAPEARQFLETLAICGRPVAPETIWEACGVAHDRQSFVVMLRTSRFIRSSGSSARVEAYHDRIREVLADRLTPEAVRRIHGRMAGALVARQSDDCEALFEHFRGAGDAARAAEQAGLAAARATTALAFDRAASLYRDALALSPAAGDVQAWREGLASALANAGQPAAAADAYLQAAAGVAPARQVELQRRAAEQFLTGGYVDRGLDLIRHVLERVGLSVARSPRTAMWSLLWRRARLGWRSLRFVPRRAEDIDPEVLLRLDTCWVAATGLALVDLITASDFIARHLQMALDAGEPSRIARGMALEAAARHADWPFRRGGARLATRAAALAADVGTPQALALELLADSVAACAVGEWGRAFRSSERSLVILRDRCVGVAWELTIAQNAFIWSLMYRGELGELSRRVPEILADARRRGDRYLATELCTRSNFVWLAADDPDGGEREAEAAIAHWSSKGFHRQHYSATLARVQTALYRGDATAAWRLLDADSVRMRRSMLTRVQALRVEWHYLRARCALAVAADRPSARTFLKRARADTRRIASERMPWSDGIARLLAAGIASVEGRPHDALLALEDAVARFDRAGMQLYAAVSRRRIGALRRDDAGRAALEEADAWMAGQQIRNAAAMTRMLAPGFSDRP